MSNIERQCLLVLFCLTVFALGALTINCMYIQGFYPEKQIEARQKQHSDQIRIALIGDSWVYRNTLGLRILKDLGLQGWQVKLCISGHPGAKTKKIYQDLFLDPDERYSSHKILFSAESYDLVVIIAGINDSICYMREGYYVHHMALLINAIIRRGCTPMILELPEYGIEEAESTNQMGRIRQNVFKYLFHQGQTDVIPLYRQSLRAYLALHYNKSDYVLMPFDDVTQDYHNHIELYRNPTHLSEAGNAKLSKIISTKIGEWLSHNRI